MKFSRVAGLIVPLLAFAGTACAQDFPVKPLRIVTSEAGGGNDLQARLVAQGLTAALGEQVIVENRPSGMIPGEIVAKALPNGYTLLLYNNALWTGPLIQSAPYDVLKDFAPVATVTRAPNVLVVQPSLPVRSLAELIALAKAKPRELNYGSSGSGASNHLAAELFAMMAGVQIVRVNYKGAGPALNALFAGEIQLMFPTAGAVAPHMKSGRLRVLAVTSSEPSALAPGVPTMAGAGLPGYESMSTYAMFAPARTPYAIIERLNHDIVHFLDGAEIKARFFNAGMETVGGSPQQLAATLKSEIARMSALIKAAGVRGN